MTTVDANVATVLRSLEAHDDLVARTIVVLHGDHGYNLGEQNRWGKQGAHYLSTRVPLLIRAPHRKHAAGAEAAGPFELIDLFPTLASLAGVPVPTRVHTVARCTHGASHAKRHPDMDQAWAS